MLGYSRRQASWGNRKLWQVEARLPQLVRELEVQAAEAAEARLRQEREQAERHRQWEAAIERAKHRLVADHRRAVLNEPVAQWEHADAIRAYCDSVEAKHGMDRLAADPGASEWVRFAHAYADQLQAFPSMPPEPEPTPEALKPYLGGLYGPSSGNRS